jgi:hypothetical protein
MSYSAKNAVLYLKTDFMELKNETHLILVLGYFNKICLFSFRDGDFIQFFSHSTFHSYDIVFLKDPSLNSLSETQIYHINEKDLYNNDHFKARPSICLFHRQIVPNIYFLSIVSISLKKTTNELRFLKEIVGVRSSSLYVVVVFYFYNFLKN